MYTSRTSSGPSPVVERAGYMLIAIIESVSKSSPNAIAVAFVAFTSLAK